jgi:hypothetical protein
VARGSIRPDEGRELHFGALAVLIRNACTFVPKPLIDDTPVQFQRRILHVSSTRSCAAHGKNVGGQIITISTTLAQQPAAGVTAALTSLTKDGLNAREGSPSSMPKSPRTRLRQDYRMRRFTCCGPSL